MENDRLSIMKHEVGFIQFRQGQMERSSDSLAGTLFSFTDVDEDRALVQQMSRLLGTDGWQSHDYSP